MIPPMMRLVFEIFEPRRDLVAAGGCLGGLPRRHSIQNAKWLIESLAVMLVELAMDDPALHVGGNCNNAASSADGSGVGSSFASTCSGVSASSVGAPINPVNAAPIMAFARSAR